MLTKVKENSAIKNVVETVYSRLFFITARRKN